MVFPAPTRKTYFCYRNLFLSELLQRLDEKVGGVLDLHRETLPSHTAALTHQRLQMKTKWPVVLILDPHPANPVEQEMRLSLQQVVHNECTNECSFDNTTESRAYQRGKGGKRCGENLSMLASVPNPKTGRRTERREPKSKILSSIASKQNRTIKRTEFCCVNISWKLVVSKTEAKEQQLQARS